MVLQRGRVKHTKKYSFETFSAFYFSSIIHYITHRKQSLVAILTIMTMFHYENKNLNDTDNLKKIFATEMHGDEHTGEHYSTCKFTNQYNKLYSHYTSVLLNFLWLLLWNIHGLVRSFTLLL